MAFGRARAPPTRTSSPRRPASTPSWCRRGRRRSAPSARFSPTSSATTCARTVSGSPAVPPVAAELASIFRALEDSASSWIRSEGDMLGEVVFDASLDMRYTGQAFDLQVPNPRGIAGGPRSRGDHGAVPPPSTSGSTASATPRAASRSAPNGCGHRAHSAARASAGPRAGTRRALRYETGVRRRAPPRTCPSMRAARSVAMPSIPGPAIIEQEDCTGVGAPRLERGRPSDRQPPDPTVEGSGRRARTLGACAAESRGDALRRPYSAAER